MSSTTEGTTSRPAALVALVVHARGVPSTARAAFAAQCAALPASEGTILVSTCHRVELYVSVPALGGAALPQLPSGGRYLEDSEAARHLISVACGLESAVLGEDQVLHQVREAYAARRATGPLDPMLDRLFQVAVNAGRRARGWFDGSRPSLGDAALDVIELRTGGLRDREILVVGAGSMGRLAAKAAAKRNARVTITNRTADRAIRLANDIGGTAVARRADEPLAPTSGVVVALSGSWQTGAADAAQVVDTGAIVVDLSSPPATSAELQSRLGERFVSIDDLAWGKQVELPGDLRSRLEALVAESGGEFCRWLRGRESVPAVQAMSAAAEHRRSRELQWLLRRMPSLSESDRALVEQMSHRLVAGLLHAPRSALRLDDTGDLGRAAYELFGL
jgi:glutamyl-tRNA reductase